MSFKPPTQLQGITDLTLLAEIRPGLIEGIFDSRSYAWRLRQVLTLLDAARRANREADELPNPFADHVGRLRGVHFFRFAVLPDNKRLFLNVTFDGGWEPYMRLIWGPLGTLLDLIFCHCVDYPLAAVRSFDDYIHWVRKNEVPSQFFYADSGGSVADRAYLNRLEALQRSGARRPDADVRAAQLALQPMAPPPPTPLAVNSALRTLKGLYGLVTVFGTPLPTPPDGSMPADGGSVLLRFAQDFLADLRGWFKDGLFDPGRRFDALREPFEIERLWLMSPRWSRPALRDRRATFDKHELQAGLLDSPQAPAERFARSALVLARVTHADRARNWLASSTAPRADGTDRLISDGSHVELTPKDVLCTVAITYSGLQGLKVHESQLTALPAEFVQGMEARAGILGDLRGNHPQQWRRPRAGAAPLDLSLVHLVIQLRTCEAEDEKQDDRRSLRLNLDGWIKLHLTPEAGIEVLAIEPGWSRPREPGKPASRDHFGYVDGISQPSLKPSAGALFWDDGVKTGELLRGWVNDRGDGPQVSPEGTHASPDWLDLGSFLVVRKIRQDVDRFDAVVEKAAAALVAAGGATSIDAAQELVRAKLMGRARDGSPLMAPRGPGANDFDYRHDSDGAQCPFASHVRRANPRTTLSGKRPPRIVRRGMSYGAPDHAPGERGVLFMAYNASIAEQFEVIQRWLTGGNSGGVSSAQPDPLLGVPHAGEASVFQFTQGDQVIRVELGDQPICRLEWGLYAFVPSMHLLASLQDWIAEAPPATATALATEPAPAPPAVENKEDTAKRQIKAEFEDELCRRARWEQVRGKSGVEKIESTVMVGGFEPLMQVLRDDGSTYSASGYGKRMSAALGGSPFGQDDVGPHAGHARPVVGAVKEAIAAAVSEEQAYATAYKFTAEWLAMRLAFAQALGLPEASVDVVALGTELLAGLFTEWFGVGYEAGAIEAGGLAPAATPIRCPGHFLSVARRVFSADPNAVVDRMAKDHGKALKKWLPRWLATARKDPQAPVLKAVLNAVTQSYSTAKSGPEDVHAILANVMLGLPATWLGSWVKVLRTWTADRSLWRLQHELLLAPGSCALHVHAVKALRHALIAMMAFDPVADGIWRTVKQQHKLGDVEVAAGDVVWLGLGSALVGLPEGDPAAEDLLFGGAFRSHTDRDTPHACPGRSMAIGALLGALAALLMAGELAATASPVVLSLKPLST